MCVRHAEHVLISSFIVHANNGLCHKVGGAGANHMYTQHLAVFAA